MRIILITPNDEEWEKWKNWANVELGSNSLETTIDDYQLYVLYIDLGSLPYYNPNDENFKTEAQQFLENLYEVIKGYNDEDTAIGIHIGGRGGEDNGLLLQWIDELKSQSNEIKELSENFTIVTEQDQEYKRPTISFYTTGSAPDQFIKKYANPNEITVLYRRILRNQPFDPNLEENLKEKWKKMGKGILKCQDKLPEELKEKESEPIYVSAECKCKNNEFYTDFNGIKQFNGTIYKLRRKGFKNPIIVVTFVENPEELKNKSILLKTPGITIWNPEKSQEPNIPEPIDDLTLKDLPLEDKGLVREILHKLHPHRTSDEISKIFNELKELAKYFNFINAKELDELEELAKEKPEQINSIREKISSSVKEKSEKREIIPERPENIFWKILFVEDDDNDWKIIKERFIHYGFKEENILRAKSYEETREKLINDTKNEITAICVDHRLLEENGDWQDIQGYTLIRKIAEEFQERNLVFFVLTGIDKDLLIALEREIGIKTYPFTKDLVLSSEAEFNWFAKELYEKSKEEYESSISLKNKNFWWKDIYIDLRKSEDSKKTWDEIFAEAEKLFNIFVKKEKRPRAPIPNLQKKPKKMEDLKPKLIARSFIIRTWIHHFYTAEDFLTKSEQDLFKRNVYEFLTTNGPRNRSKDPKAKRPSGIKALFSHHLQLNPIDDILSNNLLPEEKIYFKLELSNIDIILYFRDLIPCFYELSNKKSPKVKIDSVKDIKRYLEKIKGNKKINLEVKKYVSEYILNDKILGPMVKRIKEIREILESMKKGGSRNDE
jgi:hypothetical protein